MGPPQRCDRTGGPLPTAGPAAPLTWVKSHSRCAGRATSSHFFRAGARVLPSSTRHLESGRKAVEPRGPSCSSPSALYRTSWERTWAAQGQGTGGGAPPAASQGSGASLGRPRPRGSGEGAQGAHLRTPPRPPCSPGPCLPPGSPSSTALTSFPELSSDPSCWRENFTPP